MSDKEKIREAVSLCDLIDKIHPSAGAKAAKIRGRKKIKQIHSPLGSEKTPSFTIYTETETFKCFSTGNSGDIFSFVQAYLQISFVEAMEHIANLYDINITKKSGQEIEREKRIKGLNKFASNFFHETLADQKGKDYLIKRGLSEKDIKAFQLGWCEGNSFIVAALKAGYTTSELVDASFASFVEGKPVTAFFKRRIMFPIKNKFGRIVGFSGRRIDGVKRMKYLNSRDSAEFQKYKILYGLKEAREINRTLTKPYYLLVEGYTDVISLIRNGLPAVSSCGTGLSPEQVMDMKEAPFICRDGDKAGLKATMRDIEVFLRQGICPKIVGLPEKSDPDSFIREHGKEALEELVKSSIDWLEFAIYYLGVREKSPLNLSSPSDKSKVFKYCKKLIDSLGDEVMIHDYSLQLKTKLGLEEKKKEETEASIWEEDGQYYVHFRRGQISKSNFVMRLEEKFTDGETSFLLFNVTKVDGKQRRIILTDEIMQNAKAFCKKMGNIINFGLSCSFSSWELRDLYFLLLNTPHEESLLLDTLGYYPPINGYVFSNGIYSNTQFYKADSNGVVEIKGNRYFLRNASNLSVELKNPIGEGFLFKKGKTAFEEWFKLLREAFPENGLLGLCFVIASVFRSDIITLTEGQFPNMWVAAPNGWGKGRFVKFLTKLFGDLYFMNYGAGCSHAALVKVTKAHIDAITVINEADPKTLKDFIFALSKGFYDNELPSVMDNTKSFKDITVHKPTSATILMVQALDKLLSVESAVERSILVELKTEPNKRTKAQLEAFKKLKRIKNLGHLLGRLLSVREVVMSGFDETFEILEMKLLEEGIRPRIAYNFGIIAAPILTLISLGVLPLSYKEVWSYIVEKAKSNHSGMVDNGIVARFFEFIQNEFGKKINDNNVFVEKDELRVSLRSTHKAFADSLPSYVQNVSLRDLRRKLQKSKYFKKSEKTANIGYLRDANGKVLFRGNNFRMYRTSCLVFNNKELGISLPIETPIIHEISSQD